MDFQKIYEEFKAAEAKNDLKKMSEIISQVNEHCSDWREQAKQMKFPTKLI